MDFKCFFFFLTYDENQNDGKRRKLKKKNVMSTNYSNRHKIFINLMYTEKMKGLQNKSKRKSDKLYDQIFELAQRPGK